MRWTVGKEAYERFDKILAGHGIGLHDGNDFLWMTDLGRAGPGGSRETGGGLLNNRKADMLSMRGPLHMAMGHNLWLHCGVDEHPFATYFNVHQGYRVLTHSHIFKLTPSWQQIKLK